MNRDVTQKSDFELLHEKQWKLLSHWFLFLNSREERKKEQRKGNEREKREKKQN